MDTYKLRKPFAIDGKTYTELLVDLDEISADALISTYDEHNTRRAGNPGYSQQNLPILLIARLNNIVMEDLRSKLKGRDYLTLMKIVDNFFSDTGSPTTPSEQGGETQATSQGTAQS